MSFTDEDYNWLKRRAHKNKEEFLEALGTIFINKVSPIAQPGPSDSLRNHLARLEREIIARVLLENKRNKSRTAKKLGISRAGLIMKIKVYKL